MLVQNETVLITCRTFLRARTMLLVMLADQCVEQSSARLPKCGEQSRIETIPAKTN